MRKAMRLQVILTILLVVAVIGVMPALQAAAATVISTVTTIDDSVNDANCAASCTLRQAVNASNANDPGTGMNTITFIAGLNGMVALSSAAGFGTLVLMKNVRIDGTANQMVISGGDVVRLFVVNSGVTVAIATLTLQHGRASSNNCATNSSHACGGAIDNGGALTVMDSTLTGNTAPWFGGAILNRIGGALTVVNSTFGGNGAISGGGIFNSGTATLINSTLNQNQATQGTGGGIYNSGTASAVNTLVVNSPGGDIVGNSLTNTSNHNRTGTFAVADGNAFTPGDHGGPTTTFALSPGSSAIDAGVCNPTYTDPVTNTTVTVNTDQRGISRPQGTGCDIGAFESQGVTVHITTGDKQTTPVTTAFATRLGVTATSIDLNVPANMVSFIFTAPASGASGTFPGGATTFVWGTDISGNPIAIMFTANAVVGSYYVTVRTTSGASTVGSFSLINTGNPNAIPATHAPATAAVTSPATQPPQVTTAPIAGATPAAQPARH